MELDQIVKPNAEALALTSFRETSLLKVTYTKDGFICPACTKVAMAKRPNAGPNVWWGQALVRRGRLYARSHSYSGLCLDHVDPAPE